MSDAVTDNAVEGGGVDNVIIGDTHSLPRRSLIDGDTGANSIASIILGHDRQPQSTTALAVAVDLAGRLSAHLHIVHAIDLADASIDPDSADWDKQIEKILAKERYAITTTLRDHLTGWSYHVGHGDPSRLLANIADEYKALMIIIGSRGEGLSVSVGRLGSSPVSHRLVQHANQPVLVVRKGLGIGGFS